MNYYCLECASVWFATGTILGCCTDCGSEEIISQSEFNERFVREHLLPLPAGDSRAIERHLCKTLSGNLDYQDMILNGPFKRD